MVFSSLMFIFLFLPFVLAIYFSAPRKWKNAIIFVLSLLFYAWGEPIYIFLLIFSTIIDFCIGIYIDQHRDTYKAKIGLITSIVISILVLSVFKYSGFIVDNINNILGTNLSIQIYHCRSELAFTHSKRCLILSMSTVGM